MIHLILIVHSDTSVESFDCPNTKLLFLMSFDLRRVVFSNLNQSLLYTELTAASILPQTKRPIFLNIFTKAIKKGLVWKYNVCQKYLEYPAIYAAFDIFHSFHEKKLLLPPISPLNNVDDLEKYHKRSAKETAF